MSIAVFKVKIRSIKEVLDWRLCVGCGACAYISGGNGVRMEYVPDLGHRPVIEFGKEREQNPELLAVCPAVESEISAGDEEKVIANNASTTDKFHCVNRFSILFKLYLISINQINAGGRHVN